MPANDASSTNWQESRESLFANQCEPVSQIKEQQYADTDPYADTAPGGYGPMPTAPGIQENSLHPLPQGWQAIPDPETAGNFYYYNTMTNTTTWDRPVTDLK